MYGCDNNCNNCAGILWEVQGCVNGTRVYNPAGQGADGGLLLIGVMGIMLLICICTVLFKTNAFEHCYNYLCCRDRRYNEIGNNV